MLRDEPMKSAEANASIKRLMRFKLPPDVEKLITPKMPVEEFVKKFIQEWANKHPTLYAHSGATQTPQGKRRSLGDITRLCQFYYPTVKVSLELVKNILKDLINDKQISTDICDTIHKRVYFFRATKAQTIDETEDRDEYGWRLNLKKRTKLPRKFSQAS